MSLERCSIPSTGICDSVFKNPNIERDSPLTVSFLFFSTTSNLYLRMEEVKYIPKRIISSYHLILSILLWWYYLHFKDKAVEAHYIKALSQDYPILNNFQSHNSVSLKFMPFILSFLSHYKRHSNFSFITCFPRPSIPSVFLPTLSVGVLGYVKYSLIKKRKKPWRIDSNQ